MVDAPNFEGLAGHLHERQAHVLASHFLGAPLIFRAASVQQFSGLRMLCQEELRIMAQQHGVLHCSQPGFPAIAGDAQLAANGPVFAARGLLTLCAQRREGLDAELVCRLAVGDCFADKVVSENRFEASGAVFDFNNALSLQLHCLAARCDECLFVHTGLCARRLCGAFCHGRFLLMWA